MSPLTVTARICEALDAERARNPGADLLQAREIVIQTMERIAWEETVRANWAARRMDTPEMQRAEEPAYEVRHG